VQDQDEEEEVQHIQMGQVGVWTGSLPGPCSRCWGSADMAFFPRSQAVSGMAAFVSERQSDRVVSWWWAGRQAGGCGRGRLARVGRVERCRAL
jgi:hypothetical protein